MNGLSLELTDTQQEALVARWRDVCDLARSLRAEGQVLRDESQDARYQSRELAEEADELLLSRLDLVLRPRKGGGDATEFRALFSRLGELRELGYIDHASYRADRLRAWMEIRAAVAGALLAGCDSADRG